MSIPTDSNEAHLPTPRFNSAVWPVPYAYAQPYHPGSGSHGQLFLLVGGHQHGIAVGSMGYGTGHTAELVGVLHCCQLVLLEISLVFDFGQGLRCGLSIRHCRCH